MALDPRYFTPISLNEYFFDKDSGEHLASGTLEFWVDTNRATPKLVYEKTGSPPNYTYTSLGNSLTLSAIGTVVNGSGTNVALYYYPYDSSGNLEGYYVVCKNSSGTVQFTREGVPDIDESEDPTQTQEGVSNQLSNSQFVDVFFNTSTNMVIGISGSVTDQEYEVAPGWTLVVSTSGSDTITISRTAIAGSANVSTNPPFRLDFLPSGANVTSLVLRQRLTSNPDIWSSQYVASYMLIASLDGLNHTINMVYAPSNGVGDTTLLSGSTGTSGYVDVSDTILLDAGTNTATGDTGYVDIEVVLPTSGNYAITSLQCIGLSSNIEGIQYEQETANRQQDHLFNYYNAKLTEKPSQSFLTAWYFPYNPAQWGASVSMGAIGANKSKYLWDQLIGFQTTDNSWAVARNNFGGLGITVSTTGQIALIQYISLNQLEAFINQEMSFGMRCMTSINNVSGTVSLWYTQDGSLPDVSSGTNNSLVATLDANGKPATFNGNWTEVPRSFYGDATFTISAKQFLNQQLTQFSGWKMSDVTEAQNATYFAIVVGFSSITGPTEFHIDSISLTPGQTPCFGSPSNDVQVLQDCEYYYEKSYSIGVNPGTTTDLGRLVRPAVLDTSAGELFESIFGFEYRTPKRAAPDITLYSPSTGTADRIEVGVRKGNAWATRSGGTVTSNPGDFDYTGQTENAGLTAADWLSSSASLILNTSSPAAYEQGVIYFHYVLDARLGIV